MVRQVLDPFTGQPRFRPSHTFRLEPLARSNEVASGLAARTHDAAWLLCRQWQFGEFLGQDAGSPVEVSLSGRSRSIAAWRPRPEEDEDRPPPWRRYRTGQGPLDRRVEEEDRRPPDLRSRVEGGVHLRNLLRDAGREDAFAGILAACPVKEVRGDSALRAELGVLGLLAAEVPDGAAVARRLAAGDLGPAAARPVLQTWLAWWRERTGGPRGPGSFDEHRFEHRFELACDDLVLRADEHSGEGLDWYSVDRVDDAPAAGTAPAGSTYRFSQQALPSPVRYGGLPADRFWEMEDAQVDLGAADVSTLDTGRLLLIAFAQVYGNDWFLVPLEVPTGSLTRLTRLVVLDSFGDRWRVGRAGSADSGWNMFAVTGADDGLLVMPSVRAQDGPPVETVALARDELANTAWAIEHTVTDDLRGLVDRREAWLRDRPDPAGPGALPAYAVQTVVPDYWIPLVPVPVQGAPDAIRFEVGTLLQPLAEGGLTGTEPRGRLLDLDQWVHEEEVPRDGVRLSRRPVLARWYDGTWHAWTRREKNAGAGESSSGLEFDVVRPSDPWP
jgi:hypothetical protein